MLWSAILALLGERDGGTAGDAPRKPDEVRLLVEELAPAFELPFGVAAIPERMWALPEPHGKIVDTPAVQPDATA